MGPSRGRGIFAASPHGRRVGGGPRREGRRGPPCAGAGGGSRGLSGGTGPGGGGEAGCRSRPPDERGAARMAATSVLARESPLDPPAVRGKRGQSFSLASRIGRAHV